MLIKWGKPEELDKIVFNILFWTEALLGLWYTLSSQVFWNAHFDVFMHPGLILTILMMKSLHLETGEAGEADQSRPGEGSLYEVEMKDDGDVMKARNPQSYK